MEIIDSPTPGTMSIAHCPGMCLNSFFPSSPVTLKDFTSGVSCLISIILPT